VENKIPDSPFLGSKIPDKMHFLAHLQEVSSGVTTRNWIRRRRRRRRRRGSSRIEDLRKKKKKRKTQQQEEEDFEEEEEAGEL
jgi:REP element-mobilizing transposase RayT